MALRQTVCLCKLTCGISVTLSIPMRRTLFPRPHSVCVYGARRKSNRTRGQCHVSGGKQNVQHRPRLSTKHGHRPRHRSGRRHRRGHGQNGSRPSLPYHGVLRTRHGGPDSAPALATVWIESSVWTNAHKPSTDHRPVLSSDTGPVQASSLPWPATCNGARAAGIGFPFRRLASPRWNVKKCPARERKKTPGDGPDWLSGALGLKDEARLSGGDGR